MNAGTCWGKNTIGPRGRSVEKAPGSDFTLPYEEAQQSFTIKNTHFGAVSRKDVGMLKVTLFYLVFTYCTFQLSEYLILHDDYR
jgi:hypothetical protein